MRSHRSTFVALVTVFGFGVYAAPGWAQPAANNAAVKPLPPGGVSVIGDDALKAFQLVGPRKADATLETIDVADQPFARALRVRTLKQPRQEYHIGVEARNVRPIAQGDVLLATFYTRGAESIDESGEARAWCLLQKAVAPYTMSMTLLAGSGKGWKKWQVPFVAQESYAPNEAKAVFFVGYKPQTMEIGGVSLTTARTSNSKICRARATFTPARNRARRGERPRKRASKRSAKATCASK